MAHTIALLADIHFGCEDKQAIDAFAAALPEIDPAVVVVAGDLTYRGRRHEFEAAERWLATLKRPVVLAPGNHDVPHYNVFHRLIAPFARYDSHMHDDGVQIFNDDAVSIVTVNTARGVQARLNWAHGVISRDQADNAARTLATAPAGAARLVCCHHPLVVPKGAPIKTRTKGGEDAAAALTAAGVDVVMTGHLHRPFAEPLPFGDRKTWSVGAGTMSERQRGDPPGFTTLTRTPGAMRMVIWDAGDAVAKPREAITLELRR
ncbi:MAG: metallophosphoesterase [Hyphomonadaceae bacterium]|nr:metallophosphoesterase [Hyphomonadaceae bacterium]